MRHLTLADKIVSQIDTALRTVAGQPKLTGRPNPSEEIAEADLTEAERELAGRLMRINHAGEVSAQGLYQGQALTAKLPQVRAKMARAALEEGDHLAWCERRAKELGSHVSLLNPLWYLGSVSIGALAGIAGDRWSLGFVVETEQQVIRHLQEHEARLPVSDQRSHAILSQMREDEAHHAEIAKSAGGAVLPAPIKGLMQLSSRVMTRTAYWI